MKGQLVNQLKEFFTRYPYSRVVYLFGSLARGQGRPNSDVDVAVLFSAQLDAYDRFQERLNLMTELEKLLGREVDVIDLENASDILQHQVLKYGTVVCEKEENQRIAFEIAARRRYFDLQPLRRRYQEKVLDSLKGGQDHGRSSNSNRTLETARQLYRRLGGS